MSEKTKFGGLRGQSAGQTAVSTVGKTGMGLTYRGYDVIELAEKANFEEVAYLLLYGELPTQAELRAFKSRLHDRRRLPKVLKDLLEFIPGHAHPMDMMRSACSVLGVLEPEQDLVQQQAIAERLLAVFPSVLCYWYRFVTESNRIETVTEDDTVAGHFLHMLYGEAPNDQHQHAMDVSLILYAEHEFNASTFAARVCASTLSDFYSAVTAAIGTLRGALHGGANEAAMTLIESFETPQQAVEGVKGMLERKEKVMGFGHAVYKKSDPRNTVMKRWARTLSQAAGDTHLFPIAEAIEKLMWEEKRLFPNLDFYSALTYHFLGIPTRLFTPIFVCSRITGWSAHIIEQRAHQVLIRPSAEYVGPAPRRHVAIEERGG